MDFVWILAAVGGTLVLARFGLWAVKSLRQSTLDDDPAPKVGFTLADLRQLHKAGRISTEELELLKAKAIQGALTMEKPKKP